MIGVAEKEVLCEIHRAQELLVSIPRIKGETERTKKQKWVNKADVVPKKEKYKEWGNADERNYEKKGKHVCHWNPDGTLSHSTCKLTSEHHCSLPCKFAGNKLAMGSTTV